jgi:uncharacterized protein (TIGR03000 family)
MYSVVLMMALTSGTDTPDIGHRGGGGCQGGCYGGGGGGRKHGRHGGGGGCCGCYGGGGGCYGGGYDGCYGGGYGGCYGGGMGGCYGGGMQMMPGTPPEKLKKTPTEKKTSQAGPAAATIVVNLPADAKLLFDNEPTTSTGDSRVFVSPTLNPGREYHYTLKAQAVREGKPVTVERVIAVRAGETTPASLTLPGASVAQR